MYSLETKNYNENNELLTNLELYVNNLENNENDIIDDYKKVINFVKNHEKKNT